MRVLLFLMAFSLASCAVREQVDFVSGPAPRTTWVPVMVGTTRAPDPEQRVPGWDRSTEVTFGRYTVSIPEDREAGDIPRPRGRTEANPDEHFMVAEAQPLNPRAFQDALRSALNQQPPSEREALIFVHGFNTTFVEGLYRAAQLGHDLHLPGVLMHYSWPSLGVPLAYAHDRDSVLFARDGLVTMLQQVRAAGPRRIILVAHSMGSQLVMEALRQLALSRDPALGSIGGVILISPDIDVEVFRQQVSAIGTLPSPFIIMSSQRDRILTLSARLSGETSRLGNLPSAEPIADLGVTLIDVSAFSVGAGHFTTASSPTLINLFEQIGAVNAALEEENAGALPILPATILTLQNTTQVILQPMTETRSRRIIPWWMRLSGQAAQ